MTNYLSTYKSILTASGTSPYGIVSTRVVRDVSDKIYLLDSQNTALLTLTRRTRKKPTRSIKFEWHEDIFPAQTTTCTADDASSGDTTINVTTGALGRAGDIWFNGDTGEYIYISSVALNVWTVIRGIGGTTAADWDTGENLFYAGNAQDQGAIARTQLTTQTVGLYNYAQLFKEPYEVANDVKEAALYGGQELVYLRQKHGEIHNKDIERMLWFGVRDDLVDADDSGDFIDHEVYTSKGLLADGTNGFLTTNSSTSNSSGEYMEDEFDTDLITAFRYGGGVKFAFCAPAALSVISSWGRDKLQTFPRDSTYGINITRYVSPHGELNLINNKLFGDMAGAGSTWGSGLDFTSAIVILDLENVMLRTFRDTTLEMNIQATDQDSTEEQYLTRVGLEVHNEETCMDIYGVRAT